MAHRTRLSSDVAWDPGFLALSKPEHVFRLEDFGAGAAGPASLSPLAITSPFRVLGATGVARLQEICGELEEHSGSDERIARRARDGIYRSAFLEGLATDRDLIAFLGGLAGVSMEPHPISHQAIHINYAPLGTKREVVDQGWHWDGVSFDYVMMVSDPSRMRGGHFEFYRGSVEEGEERIAHGLPLQAERIGQAAFPGPGWAVLMQAHRVLHRVEPLAEPYPRVTLIGSFYTYDPLVPDPQERTGPLYDCDPAETAITEWSRFSAVVASRKLSPAQDAKAASGFDLDRLRQLITEGDELLTRARREIDTYEHRFGGRPGRGTGGPERLHSPTPSARSEGGS